MDGKNEYCAICKHSKQAHSLGNNGIGACSELRSTTLPERNRAAYTKSCTCPGFVSKT